MAQRAKNKPELKIVVSNALEAPAVESVPEQVEMPFAIVNGEPVTQMPKDLYIPPQAMEVFLEAFEGPLDLLLYLIRRQNLNILDIPLAEITRQYMQYIEVMTELQLELAGEYMVMAATLAEIKSRMLLPRPKVDQDGNEEDPRAELVRRLQEYERFKRAAEGIDALPRLERDVWSTSAELKDRKVVRLLPTVTLQEMLLAFKDVVVRSEMFAHHHIQRERLSVRERMTDVMSVLESASFVEFVRLFRIDEGRMGVTVTFMAILELVREGLVEIVQAEPFAPIHVRAAGASRKLHVVGGNDALPGEAVVVGEAVVGDAPAIGVLTSAADLESITELVLDPNFVDDDEDEEDGPLEGVDDVVDAVPASTDAVALTGPAETDLVAPADAALGEPLDVALAETPEADSTALADAPAEVALAEPTEIGFVLSSGVALVASSADVVAAVEPTSVVDEFGAAADLSASASASASYSPDIAPPTDLATSADFVAPAAAIAESASLVSDASVEPTSVVDEFASAGFASLVEAPAEPAAALHEVHAIADSEPSTSLNESALTTDVVAAAVDSVLVAEPSEAWIPAADFQGASLSPPLSDDAPVHVGHAAIVGATATLSESAAVVEQSSALGEATHASLSTGADEAGAVVEQTAVSGEATAVSSLPGADEVAAAGATNAFDEPGAVVEQTDEPPAVGVTTALDEAGAVVEQSAVLGEATAVSSLPGGDEVAAAGATNAFDEPGAVVEQADEPLAFGATAALDEAGAVVEQTAVLGIATAVSSLPGADEVADFAGSLEVAAAPIDVPSSTAGGESQHLSDVVAATVESMLTDVAVSGVPDIAVRSEPWLDQIAVIIEPVSAPDANAELSQIHVASVDPTLALDEAGATVELAPVQDSAAAEVAEPLSDVVATAEPSILAEQPSMSAAPTGDDIAVTFEPSVAEASADVAAAEAAAVEPSPAADVTPVAEPTTVADEGAVTVDPAVFDAPVATVESEPSDGTPPGEEPPALDVEYEISAEEIAAAEEAAVSDDSVSLVGETPVAGEVSLVGDESVSGGPTVEVEEFAFDELPALDEAGHADQQPAAGAQTVVEKLVGTDEPPSPGEESDD